MTKRSLVILVLCWTVSGCASTPTAVPYIRTGYASTFRLASMLPLVLVAGTFEDCQTATPWFQQWIVTDLPYLLPTALVNSCRHAQVEPGTSYWLRPVYRIKEQQKLLLLATEKQICDGLTPASWCFQTNIRFLPVP